MSKAFLSHIDSELQGLKSAGLYKSERVISSMQSAEIEVGGQKVLNFCANNYLGLADSPDLRDAAKRALDRYGYGMASVRFICGTQEEHKELEATISSFLGMEDTILYSSCFDANGGLFETLLGEEDAIISDALNHASIIDGVRLSKAKRFRYANNDMADLEARLKEAKDCRFRLIATDGVFSMDGDIAPLDQLSEVCAKHDAWLLSDDAHGVGVLAEGRGSAALFPGATIPLQMGTLSKALGSYGGYLCGSQAVVDLLKTRARTLVYATGLPPASAAAALAALDIVETQPALTALPLTKARLFTARLGLPEATSPIVPVVLGSADAALSASTALEARGFLVVAIRPPTVPEGTARLRVAFNAAHDDADVIRLADAIGDLRGSVA